MKHEKSVYLTTCKNNFILLLLITNVTFWSHLFGQIFFQISFFNSSSAVFHRFQILLQCGTRNVTCEARKHTIAWLHISQRRTCFNYLLLLTAQWHSFYTLYTTPRPPYFIVTSSCSSGIYVSLQSISTAALITSYFTIDSPRVVAWLYCSSHVHVVRNQPRVKLISCRNNSTCPGNKRADHVRCGLNRAVGYHVQTIDFQTIQMQFRANLGGGECMDPPIRALTYNFAKF